MAKDIPRKKLKRVLSDIDNGVYNNPQVFSQHSGVYKVLNETGRTIYKGSTVTLKNFKGMPSYESAVTQMLSGSIVFGSTNTIYPSQRLYVKARETILPGKIGVIDAPNIFVARVKINSDSHDEVSCPYPSTSSPIYETEPDGEGYFYLVAKSPEEGDYAICAFGLINKKGIDDVILVEGGEVETFIDWRPESKSSYGTLIFSGRDFGCVPTDWEVPGDISKMLVIRKTVQQCVTSIAVVGGAIEITFGQVTGVL